MKRVLDESEARGTEAEMTKRALEGEIQRLNMILTDKDTEIQVHQERCDALITQIQVNFSLIIFEKETYVFPFVVLGSRREMSIASIECRSSFIDIGQS